MKVNCPSSSTAVHLAAPPTIFDCPFHFRLTITAGHRKPPRSSDGVSNSCTPTSTPSSFRKHSCNSNTSQSTSIEICDRKMSARSSARPATFQLNTFNGTGAVAAIDSPEFLLFLMLFTLGYFLQYPCVHLQDDREPSEPFMASSILASFPDLLSIVSCSFIFFASTSLLSHWASIVQPAISSAEASRVHPASLFEADPLQNASSCCSTLRISSVFSGDKKWLLFLSIVSPSLRRSSLRILISSYATFNVSRFSEWSSYSSGRNSSQLFQFFNLSSQNIFFPNSLREQSMS